MYDYKSAKEGVGDAAPPPPSLLVNNCSCGQSGSIIAAYKDEVKALKDTLVAMNQSQGGSEVLEGKYLAQIKKCRNATVQLEVERSRSKQLETQLEVAQADLEKRKGKPAPAGQRRGGSSSARSASSDGHPEDSFKPEEVIRTLKERLDRTYQQLQEKTIQIEESKRDQHRLVQLVCKEVGRPKEEVEQYLRSDGESQPTKMNESAAGGLGQGWKGRAANIVLLKGRIKDLEKEVALHKASASDMASKLEIMKDGDVSLGVGDDSESLARLIRHREKTALFSQLDGQSTQARSVDINGAPSKLDVDDQSRQHVAAMESKRLGSLRDVEGALAQVTKQLQDEKLKQTALQARFNTLQQDNQQLRSYVETILRKSSTDDELLSAYKDEVRELRVAQKRLQVELQEVRMEAELNDGNDGAVEDRAIHVERHTVSKGETGSEDEYRRQIDDLTRRLEVAQEALSTAPQLDATPTPLETQLVRWVQEGLRRFCSNENTSEASASGEPVAKNVAAFVHAAHEHVLRMEVLRQCGADRKTHDVLDRYDQLLGTVHELLSSAGPQQNAKTLVEVYRQLASLPPLNQVLVKSNKKLDERIQGLTEMMERDALVHRALLLQQEQEKQRAASNDRMGAEGKRAAETSNDDYKALQKKYNDLRMAFNGLQHQRMTAQ